MIVGKSNILSWFSSEPNFIYWKIYRGNEKNSGYYIIRSTQEENLTKNDAYAQLNNALTVLGMGKYEISMQEKPGTVVKGSATTDFELSHHEHNGNYNANNNAQIGSVSMSGFVSKDEVEKIANERFEKLINKQKLDDAEKRLKELEKKNKELEDDASSPLNQIAGLVLPMLMPKTQQPQPLAQVGTLHTEDEHSEMTTEEQEAVARLQTVLNRVETTFGEPSIPFLEKLLNYIDANPQFVGMIKSFVK